MIHLDFYDIEYCLDKLEDEMFLESEFEFKSTRDIEVPELSPNNGMYLWKKNDVCDGEIFELNSKEKTITLALYETEKITLPFKDVKVLLEVPTYKND